MRARHSIIIFVATQIAGAVLSLFFFRYVWPGPPYGIVTRLFTAATPYLIWLAPFLIYAAAEIAWRVARGRFPRISVAFFGGLAIAIAYGLSLTLLKRWEEQRFREYYEQCLRSDAEACMAGFIADPPLPPQYWEWSAAGCIVALIGLYAILYRWRLRAARSETGASH